MADLLLREMRSQWWNVVYSKSSSFGRALFPLILSVLFNRWYMRCASFPLSADDRTLYSPLFPASLLSSSDKESVSSDNLIGTEWNGPKYAISSLLSSFRKKKKKIKYPKGRASRTDKGTILRFSEHICLSQRCAFSLRFRLVSREWPFIEGNPFDVFFFFFVVTHSSSLSSSTYSFKQ